MNEEIGHRVSFDINETLKAIVLPEEFEGKKIVGKVVLTKLEETILAEGDFVAGVVLICDRCLVSFKAHIPFRLEREYNLNRNEDSIENLFVDKYGEIDLSEAIREDIILNIPMKNICDAKCLGICPGCGVNLNIEECRCGKKDKSIKVKKE